MSPLKSLGKYCSFPLPSFRWLWHPRRSLVGSCITPVSVSIVSGLPSRVHVPIRLALPLLPLIKTPAIGFRAQSSLA